MRLRRVLDDDEAMAASDFDNRIHLCHEPVEMDRKDCFCAGCHGRFDQMRIHRPSVGVNIDENGLRNKGSPP
jgi:hypothetical protein